MARSKDFIEAVRRQLAARRADPEVVAAQKKRALGRVEESLDAVLSIRPAKGQHRIERPGDIEIVFDAAPQRILDRYGNVIGVDATVRVFHKGQELRVDPHRICINPPLSVADGVGEKRTLRRAPWEAYLQWLDESLLSRPHPRGWRTRGTVTTVFSMGDGYIYREGGADYDAFRSGTPSFASADSTDTVMYTGQRFTGIYSGWECFLDFDTSSLPDADPITDVDLQLYGAGQAAGTAFIYQARLYEWGGALSTGDWVNGDDLSGAQILLATMTSAAYVPGGYGTFTEEGTDFRTWIDKAGNTPLVINSDRLSNYPNIPTGNEYGTFSTSEVSGTTQDPKLTMTHGASTVKPWEYYARQHNVA